MLKVLIKSRFQSLFYSMFKAKRADKKKVNPGKRAFTILLGVVLTVYVVGVLLFACGSMFYTMCEPMVTNGLTWLYFALVGIVSLALCFIGSVFTTQTQIYDAKDNELLLSMPVPPRYILASRIIMLLGLNYIYEAFIIIPAVVVFCMVTQLTLLSAVVFVIGFLLLPFLAMTLSCIVGWLVNLITSRLKNKTIFTMILSLGFLGLYFYVYFQMSNYMQSLVEHLGDVSEAVRKAFYPFYQLGVAIADADWLALLLFALCAIVPFVIIYVILSKSFIHMATMKRGAARIVYKEKELKESSPKAALVHKELRHLTSSAMYMMNAALGVIFLFVGAVALAIKQDAFMDAMNSDPELAKYMIPILCLGIAGMGTMNFISAPSISLEGKNLWIAQSIPVKTMDILMAKVDMHLIVCIPPILLTSTVAAFVTKGDVLDILMLFLVPILYTIFSALAGLALNLKFPKFNWINETVAVKQSLSGMLTMFGSMAMCILPIILYALLLHNVMSVYTFIWIFCVVLALICLGIYEYIKHIGTKIFQNLTNE